MKITNENGQYIATFKHRDGNICMGFAPSWPDAARYCLERIQERDVASRKNLIVEGNL